MAEISSESQFFFSGSIANMIPEGPLNKMVTTHGGWRGAWGRHFADDIFRCISLNENVWISIKISLKFIP